MLLYLPKLTSIKSVIPSSHLILCRPLLLLPQSLPASESFPTSQLLAGDGQSIEVSALAPQGPASVLQGPPLGMGPHWLLLKQSRSQRRGRARVPCPHLGGSGSGSGGLGAWGHQPNHPRSLSLPPRSDSPHYLAMQLASIADEMELRLLLPQFVEPFWMTMYR